MSVRELADIDESRIELINEFEVKVKQSFHIYLHQAPVQIIHHSQ
jgi:hypothetical protein